MGGLKVNIHQKHDKCLMQICTGLHALWGLNITHTVPHKHTQKQSSSCNWRIRNWICAFVWIRLQQLQESNSLLLQNKTLICDLLLNIYLKPEIHRWAHDRKLFETWVFTVTVTTGSGHSVNQSHNQHDTVKEFIFWREPKCAHWHRRFKHFNTVNGLDCLKKFVCMWDVVWVLQLKLKHWKKELNLNFPTCMSTTKVVEQTAEKWPLKAVEM